MERFEYFAYGLRIRSSIELGLPRSASPAADLVVRRGGRDDLAPVLEAGGVRIETEIGDAAVAGDGSEVVFAPAGDPSPSELRLFLRGMVMLQVLGLRGAVCLHGSAVRAADGAVAFVGPSGRGKSTIAAALVREGCALLTDDMLPVRLAPGRVETVATHPSLRLWDDGMRHIGVEPRAADLAPGYDNKYVVSLAGDGAPPPPDAVRLSRLYLLERAKPGEGAGEAGPIDAPRALFELARNALRPYHLTDDMQRTRLATLAALLERARVRTLRVPGRLSDLPPLAAALAAGDEPAAVAREALHEV